MRSFFNLFLKSNCPLCNRPTAKVFCLSCQDQIDRQKLANPTQFWQEQPAVFAWGTYGGSLKRAIAQFKYENQRQLARPFGEWLAQAWLHSMHGMQPAVASELRRALIVPIPLHAQKQQQRGFNQAELLAQQFCQLTGCSLKPKGLQRARSTEALFGLSKGQREQMMTEAFELGKEFQPGQVKLPVVLFDDIYTTGATVRSAMQTLRRHGIRVQGVIVLAKTPFQ